MEPLEPRVLLSSGADVSGVTTMEWRGAEISVMEDSWLVTFEKSIARHQVERQTAAVANELGVLGYANIRVLGSRFALITVEQPSTIYGGPEQITEERIDEVVERRRLVMGIDPNAVHQTQRIPNDEFFGLQWYHDNVGAPIGGFPATAGADISSIDAWDTTIGTRDAIVAVIDSGVDWNHPDLAANIWTNPNETPNGMDDDGNGFVDDIRGWDFGDFDNDPDDDSAQAGHGTAVAGVIGAVGDNGIGIAGVNWNVSILPMKVADSNGTLSIAAIVGAHDYLTMMRGMGHNIVASNNSYGTFAPDFFIPGGFVAEREAIADFIASGGTFVAAAGNEGADLDAGISSYPASYDVPGIIAVAATDANDALAGFSNFGASTVHLGAPGVNIMTTLPNGAYGFVNGTSFASPIVAGAVALLKSIQPDASAVSIREALMNGADRVAGLQGVTISGGRLNVARSLDIIGITGPVVTSFQPGPITGSPLNEIVVRFNKQLAPLGGDVLDNIELLASGGDGTFGDGNEVTINISSAVLGAGGTRLTITPAGPLGAETYRLTLASEGFQDTLGNFLNGDTVSGEDEVYTFRVENVSGKLEPNDTLASAHVVDFGTTGGTVNFVGLTLGDGTQAALDVDLFRIDMARGGLISAKVIAQQLVTPSSFDSYLRLFDASGNELAANDQFFGNDSFIDFFVTTGGTYYIGVSGFPNVDYNPFVAGSGITQSTGTYNLELSVTPVADTVLNTAAVIPPGGIALPDTETTASFINISDQREILDVNVRIDIEHDFVSDLTISLFAPDGTEVILVDRRGGAGENFTGTVFDDEAPVSVASMTPSGAPFSRSYRPETALGVLDGKLAAGQWTLVVRDNVPLNEGRLLGWNLELTLRNDIFGPFELNDTLTTARPLPELDGFGTAQRSAVIGDGAFGVLDVDIFSFTAQAGSTLSASVTSGSLNSAIRLFNGVGQELTFSSPTGSNNSQIDQFVFVTGGTYYIGVSEAAGVGTLDAYDPTIAASGVPAETTGSYLLTVTLSPGVIDNGVALQGDHVRADITSTGALNRLSLNGDEFLVDLSSPEVQAFFGATANRNSFRNDGIGGDSDIPFFFQTESDPFNQRAYMETTNRGLRVERSISFGAGDQFLAIDVSLTNTTAAVMTNVAWMEAFNPSQGLNQAPGTTERTVNDLLDGSPLAISSFFNTIFSGGLSIALGAIDGDERASAVFMSPETLVRDPQQLLSGAVGDPDGAADNLVMGLHYDLGILDSNSTATMRYFIFLADDAADIVGPNGLYATMNDTRADGQHLNVGHLTADTSAPALDSAGLPDLAYRAYHPEGYANDRSSTFVPIVNPTSRDARVVVIARYETGVRDQVLFDGVVAAGSRSPDALTITTPEMYAAGTQLVRADTPYALEIRSDAPVLATMSHFDFGHATGETFSNRVSDTWTFADLKVGGDNRDFLTFLNTSGQQQKIVTTLIPAEGGPAIVLTADVGIDRRAGWNLHDENIPAGRYGAIVEAQFPFVAAATSFNTQQGGAYGIMGTVGTGDRVGAIPEGEIGLRAESERISIFNAGTTQAIVTLTFLFDNGTTDRRTIEVNGRRIVDINVEDFIGFPEGRAYSVHFDSTRPVVVSATSGDGSEALAASSASQAHTYWGFSEGFRPVGSIEQVTEYLRVFNPAVESQLVEIVIRFTDGASETFRGTVLGGTVGEFNLHDFIRSERVAQAAGRGDEGVFYGLTVKTASPVVAYMGRTDQFFQGSFGTLGVPLGIDAPLT